MGGGGRGGGIGFDEGFFKKIIGHLMHTSCFYMLLMLHASAAFKGGDNQNFWEGGRPYIGGLSIYGGT